MTDTFTQIKKDAQTVVSSQLGKQEGWVRANRKGLIIGAASIALVWALAHHFF